MEQYLVGGAVRDILRNRTPSDLDFVVVGSTVEHMLNHGYLAVGKDFPVFLKDGHEYALARRERSTGNGHNDFEVTFGPEVTLEEDLLRRDLTINAMALTEDNQLIDPYGGQKDLLDKVLRHTSDAFTDDPLRVFRLFRFHAQFGHEWTIAPETMELVHKMAKEGFCEHLTTERVWKETVKAMSSSSPSIYFKHCVNFTKWFPELKELLLVPQRADHHSEIDTLVHVLMVLDEAAKTKDPVIVFGALCHDLGKSVTYKARGNLLGHEEAGLLPTTMLCDRLKVPNEYRELGMMSSEFHLKCHTVFTLRAATIYALFQRTRALANPNRFYKFLEVCKADANGRGGIRSPYPQSEYLRRCLQISLLVDTKKISSEMLAKGDSGSKIGEAIKVAIIKEIDKFKMMVKHASKLFS